MSYIYQPETSRWQGESRRSRVGGRRVVVKFAGALDKKVYSGVSLLYCSSFAGALGNKVCLDACR